jgi:hypothetical protein
MWELKNTVFPAALRSRMMPRTSIRPIGSSPDIGSSRITSSGSCSSAWASPSRCIIPLEYFRIAVSRAPESPTRARSSEERDSVSARDIPHS